ncbi:MAG: hypothetical protein SO375_10305 [Prevotella sp.]|nr:hypothetical protein [Prevotella sp.]MDY4684695.1 hypothetical protein [Prevotella sp.]
MIPACCGYALDVVRIFLWIANQFVFLGKSICFPQQINLNSSANQFTLLRKMMFIAVQSIEREIDTWRLCDVWQIAVQLADQRGIAFCRQSASGRMTFAG